MRIPQVLKTVCVFSMSALMSNAPQLAFAQTVGNVANLSMIPTTSVVADLTRDQAQAKIQDFVNRTDVRQMLTERGLSHEEVSLRLAALSKTEMNSLSSQLEEARAGGDILVAILLVVLIIFLIQRI